MDTNYSMTVEESPDPADVQFVRAQLTAFNRARAADDQFWPLVILVRDASGQIAGGLVGGTYWGWLHTEVLWVEEGLRGQGYGRSLLAAAEAEAVRRGCCYAHLDTMSFQGLQFYEKQGYFIFGELEDMPAGSGHRRHLLKERLAPGQD
ncbi:MAG: GNAT family N-acetyltransferase [Anaerolineae bacterium]|nr:GNAT family N-acetyltransferase [Anaerolineae bacterium]